jgi:hypothetical protein
MTRPLRRAHMVIWLVLPAFVALVVMVSLAERRSTTPRNPGVTWELAR